MILQVGDIGQIFFLLLQDFVLKITDFLKVLIGNSFSPLDQ